MDKKAEISGSLEKYDAEIASNPENAGLYYERGKLHWKLGHRAEAITDFNTAVSLDPASPAKSHLEMLTDIMDFYNTDLYNP